MEKKQRPICWRIIAGSWMASSSRVTATRRPPPKPFRRSSPRAITSPVCPRNSRLRFAHEPSAANSLDEAPWHEDGDERRTIRRRARASGRANMSAALESRRGLGSARSPRDRAESGRRGGPAPPTTESAVSARDRAVNARSCRPAARTEVVVRKYWVLKFDPPPKVPAVIPRNRSPPAVRQWKSRRHRRPPGSAFSSAPASSSAPGFYMFRHRKQFFGYHGEEGDTYASANLRMWLVILVWIHAVVITTLMIFEV